MTPSGHRRRRVQGYKKTKTDSLNTPSTSTAPTVIQIDDDNEDDDDESDEHEQVVFFFMIYSLTFYPFMCFFFLWKSI